MRSLSKQQGMSALGVGIITMMVVFCLTVFVKLLPGYLEHFNVTSSLDALQEDTTFRGMSNDREIKKKISTALRRRFEVNDVDSVNLKKNLKIQSSADGYQVAIHYHYKTHMMGNVDAIVNFEDEIVISTK